MMIIINVGEIQANATFTLNPQVIEKRNIKTRKKREANDDKHHQTTAGLR